MTKLAIIQMTPYDRPGLLPKALNQLGINWVVFRTYIGEFPNEASEFDAFTLLGGHFSVNKLPSELKSCFDLVEKTLKDNKPILGHCLGGQIIAKTLGANIGTCENKELGWYNITSLFDSGWPTSLTVFQWHSEGFQIPRHSTKLYTSDGWHNQAFIYKSALAMQFHLEVDEYSINEWCQRNNVKLPENTNIHHDNLNQQFKYLILFYRKWLKIENKIPDNIR